MSEKNASKRARLVALSGLAGSGKSTAAAILERDRRYAVVSLADPIKRACAEWFQFTDEQLWGPSDARNAPDHRYQHIVDGGPFGERVARCLTPRRALQFLGTEVGRELYREVWVEYALRTVDRLMSGEWCAYSRELGVYSIDSWCEKPPPCVVIPDVRFESELDALRDAGAITVRIVRPCSGLQGDAGTHPSETDAASLPDSSFDHVVQNNGTLEHLASHMLSVVDNQ